ncbi:hypothetical protein DFJ74DRAFT_691592 [Hyaloraphidium curvatum]|nr:hypothetical protein DFJ74DRAFT_691592 [Hyaloraphidium curvatum]
MLSAGRAIARLPAAKLIVEPSVPCTARKASRNVPWTCHGLGRSFAPRHATRSFTTSGGPQRALRGPIKQAVINTDRVGPSDDGSRSQFHDPLDEDLRRLFDDPSPPSRGAAGRLGRRGKQTGLFGDLALTSPDALLKHSRRALKRANAIVERVCSPPSGPEDLYRVVRRLDRLSDVVCSVVDAAEVIRNIHPDPRWVAAADEVHAQLSSYLNQLNTHQGLYEALKRANSVLEVRSSWSPTEKRVADLLLSDFEKSGIHMAEKQRLAFVHLHDEILRVGHRFTLNGGPGVRDVDVADPWNKLRGVRSDVIRSLIQKTPSGEVARIPTAGYPAQLVMRTARDEDVRRRLYLAMNSATEDQVEVLDRLLRLRAELARLLGKRSYAQVYLEDKMARDPARVMQFLKALSDVHKPRAQLEMDNLRKLKQLHGPKGSGTDSPTLEAWDRQFYSQFLPQPPADAVFPAMHMPLAHPVAHGARSTSGGVSLGTVIAGLSRLLHILYGIRLVPATAESGELWHHGVRRMDAVHDVEGRVGTIYCDLLSREREGSRKYENAAHFTVQCSRRMDWDVEDPIVPADGIEDSVVVPGREGRFKLPVVVLVTNFNPGSKLTWVEVETVFHEMGHAVHSMLARTDFQHVAGTRCQMDFVEVPSTLMEFLLRYVGIPGVAVPPFQRDSLDLQTQLRLAVLDQVYHSDAALSPDFDSTEIGARIQRQFDVLPYVTGTAWQVQFGHLFSYGCGYYTYLWSRLWAGRIFRKLFAGKGEQEMRAGGDRLRTEVLEWGGGRDGWESLKALGIVKDEDESGLSKVSLEELGM